MNILILQTKAFPHRENSFSWFYTQLTDWLTAQGFPSQLYYAYLKTDDRPYDNGLLLPDCVPSFYSPQNISVLSDYITTHRIQLLLDYSHVITGNTRCFFMELRQRHPELKMFTMIHNCPRHTSQLKQHTLNLMKWKDVHSLKQALQLSFPSVYLYLLKKVEKWQNRSAYNTMDEVVLLSPAYLSDFRQLIGIPDADRISAIPNAIRPVRSRIPVEEKAKEIVFAGRMTPEKAVEKLLFIWQKAAPQLKDWKLILVGDGEWLERYKTVAQQLQLSQIEFTGYQMAIPYIDRAAVLCLTSVIEGLPTVFTEAMNLGTVPMGFNSFKAINDMISDGKTGFVIPDNDTDTYVRKLVQLCSDNRLRFQMGHAACNQENRYDMAHIGPLWMQTFRKHGLLPEEPLTPRTVIANNDNNPLKI